MRVTCLLGTRGDKAKSTGATPRRRGSAARACHPAQPLTADARVPRGAQVQRLQRHATYGHLKQLVLRMIAEDVLAETETQAADMLSALRCGQSLSVGMLSVSRCRSILSCRRRARAALLGARPLSADAAPGLQDRALWGRGSRSDRQQAVNMIAAGCADWRAPAARLLAACHKPAHQPHRHSTGSFCPRSCCLLQLRLCLPPGSQARVLVAQGVVAATGMCTQDAVRPAGHGRVGRHRRRRAGGGPGRPGLPGAAPGTGCGSMGSAARLPQRCRLCVHPCSARARLVSGVRGRQFRGC